MQQPLTQMIAHVRRLTLLICLALSLTLAACAASPDHIDDGIALKNSVQEFHKNLRWARYQEAALHVSPDYRNTFLGRYEELGEEFHITELEVKSVLYEKDEDNNPIAIVETEQQWYKERTMTIKKERFIERWRRDREGWQMLSRDTKDEWKAKQKEKLKKSEAAKEAPKAADEPPAPTPSPAEPDAQ